MAFNRGVSVYPALGDRVRVASRQELEQAPDAAAMFEVIKKFSTPK